MIECGHSIKILVYRLPVMVFFIRLQGNFCHSLTDLGYNAKACPSEVSDLSEWQFILGSQSPRRRQLLQYLRVPFKSTVSRVDETCHETDPVKFVDILAKRKAAAVQDQLASSVSPRLILTSDTTVAIEDRILEKPDNEQHARDMLLSLSGKTHLVATGVCLLDHEGHELTFVETSLVTFDRICRELLDPYVASGEPLDKAGAYGIQGAALGFIRRVEGCYSNVMGLPLSRLNHELSHFFDRFHPEIENWRQLNWSALEE